MTDVFEKTAQLNRELLGIPRPVVPTRMEQIRKEWFHTAAIEELTEFMDADNLADEVDAVLDLMYFAGGRLYEMGVDAAPIFDAIHDANMKKVKGALAKRPGSKGYDAIKPEGWTPPDVEGILAAQKRPKLIVIGHGRHGKDTVGEMLNEQYGLTFKSSSLFCAEKVVWPLVQGEGQQEFLSRFKGDEMLMLSKKLATMYTRYHNAQECFDGRHAYRDVWFQAIAWYCSPAERLATELFAENDIYCGIRSPRELQAAKNANIADAVIWVDALDRLPPEGKDSMRLEPWMATHVIDNNGTLEELEHNLEVFMAGFYG